MFCRNVGTAKQLINNCKGLLSQHKLQPTGNGWFQIRNNFRSSRHREKRAGFETDPLEHFHIESGPLHARGLVKPFLFTIGVSTVSLAGCVIWEYENLRFHASNLLRRPGTWLSVQQKKFMGHKSETNTLRKWWNSLRDSEKVFYPILAANVLVFGAWRVRALQPFMVKYFCSNPSGRAICLPMLLSTFSHYSALHLAANMYVLYSFMPAAIASLGKEQFVAMYLSAGVVSSFASFMYKILLNHPGLSLGASGAIMAVLSYVCVQYPDTRLSIIFLPMYTFAAGSAIKVIMGIDLAGVMFGWKFFDHAAHLGGAVFGIWVYALQNTTLFASPQFIKSDNSLGDIQLEMNVQYDMNGDFGISSENFEKNTSTPQLQIEEINNDMNIHQALAKAIYVSGAPLSLLEHPLWKGALNLINPQYTPPSYKALSTTLLDKEYANMQTVIEQTVKQAGIINLAIDGWRNKSLLNLILYAPTPLVYKYFATGENQLTDLLFKKVLEIMNQFGAENFFGIIADNAEYMIQCGALIANKYPHVIWLACLAHTLHLLIREIIKSSKVQELYSQIVDVVQNVLNSPSLKARFMIIAEENNIKSTLNLPMLDDWESYISCLHNFLESKPILQTMANEGYEPLRKYKTQLLDNSTWHKLKKLEEFLTPLNDWNLKFKTDNSIHLVHKALKELSAHLSNPLSSEFLGEDLKAITANFNEKKNNVLKSIHLAAAILDPKNQGSDLTNEEYLEGSEYIINKLTDGNSINVRNILEEFNNYKNRTDAWQEDSIWKMAEKVSPKQWWQSLDSKTKLRELAMKILSVPATSTLPDKSLSNTNTILRDILNTDVTEKIKLITQNWELMNGHVSRESEAYCPVNKNDIVEDKNDDLGEISPLHSSVQEQKLIQEDSVINSINDSDSIRTNTSADDHFYYHHHFKDYF